MIYAYIRVSTDKQTVENQRFEINRFAKQMCGWKKRFQEHGQPKTESLAYY